MASLSVRELIARFRTDLLWELLNPGEQDRQLAVPKIQKSGLALAGYLEHTDPGRSQVLGQAETGYLATLPADRAQERLRAFCSQQFPCIILSRNADMPAGLREMCAEYRTPLLRSGRGATEIITALSRYLEYHLAPVTWLHGGLMDLHGVGVLITGQSGIGKSECCLDLVTMGHSLVADDIVSVRSVGGQLVGTGNPDFRHLMEVRGMGIIDISELFGTTRVRESKTVDLIVELQLWDNAAAVDYERLGLEHRTRHVLGLEIPLFCFPMRPGRNIAKVIEVLARTVLLRRNSQAVGTAERVMEQVHQNISRNKYNIQGPSS